MPRRYPAEVRRQVIAEQQETTGDGWLRGAGKIAAYIGAPRSRVYGLVSARRIPVHHDGSALIARRSELDVWLLNGGGRRFWLCTAMARVGIEPTTPRFSEPPNDQDDLLWLQGSHKRRVAEVADGFQGFWVPLDDEIRGRRPLDSSYSGQA